jgi:hypothetical protein
MGGTVTQRKMAKFGLLIAQILGALGTKCQSYPGVGNGNPASH